MRKPLEYACTLADRSGQNCGGFMTTVADEAKAYLLDASAEGNLVRLLPTSSPVGIAHLSSVGIIPPRVRCVVMFLAGKLAQAAISGD